MRDRELVPDIPGEFQSPWGGVEMIVEMLADRVGDWEEVNRSLYYEEVDAETFADWRVDCDILLPTLSTMIV